MALMRVVCVVFFCVLIRPSSTETVDELLNRCMVSKTQKSKPSPEPGLQGVCSPWKENSCCDAKIARDVEYNATWMDFDFNHCPGKTLSPQCEKYFKLDLCFYECSPNKGPWIKKVDQTFRKERFIGVPLCESDCLSWWEACKDAYTCLSRWDKGFDWSEGQNKCPAGNECRKFTEVFQNSVDFCQNLWGGSWKVVSDMAEECVKIEFSGSNPNNKVAREYAGKIVSGAVTVDTHFRLTVVSVLMYICHVHLK
ncbi:folate receptor alpha-like [Liolophura sinensis]|uniref:folate receptor alpha-like n=1 Tax=Liolophura sinensis TaxID=3198878 RepID=UPI00315953B7